MAANGERDPGNGGDRKSPSRGATVMQFYRCPICRDFFNVEGVVVWHCRQCDHHCATFEDDCKYCHADKPVKANTSSPIPFEDVPQELRRPYENRPQTLADLGIPRDRASRAMQLAEVPQEQFDGAPMRSNLVHRWICAQ
jgi:hypothetical protein